MNIIECGLRIQAHILRQVQGKVDAQVWDPSLERIGKQVREQVYVKSRDRLMEELG
jgi:hypothetical protein